MSDIPEFNHDKSRAKKTEHKILPIGVVLGVDGEGYLVSQSSADRIQSPWDMPVAEVRDEYIERLGSKLHSLYIRGSVSRGNAVEGISDVDGLAVVYGDPKEIDWSWAHDFGVEMGAKYPFLKGVDISRKSQELIIDGEEKIAAFLIKTMSACVYGQDLAPQLPKIKPGREALIARWGIENKVRSDYLANEVDISVAQKTRWTAKQILRAGFELVMEQEQAYTRDLYPCYQLFSKHFPQMEPVMCRALEMALWPANDGSAYQKLLADIGPWLAAKLIDKYPK